MKIFKNPGFALHLPKLQKIPNLIKQPNSKNDPKRFLDFLIFFIELFEISGIILVGCAAEQKRGRKSMKKNPGFAPQLP